MSRLDLKGRPRDRQEREARQDGTLRALLKRNPAQIERWVDRHVTDLESAKVVLAKLAVAVAVLARREFPEFDPDDD